MANRKRKTSPMVVIPFKETTERRKTSTKKKVHFDIPATSSSDDELDDFIIITGPRERMTSPMVVIPFKETQSSETSPNSKKKKHTRSSFLDLPREIRQAILLQVKPSPKTWSGEKELIRKWVRILGKVRESVERDMVFVEAVWRMEAGERFGEGGVVEKGLFRGGAKRWGLRREGSEEEAGVECEE